MFLFVAGGALQWSVSIREPPRSSGVVPLHEGTNSLQLPVWTWGCRIQKIPFSGDWEHPSHRSQTPFWNSGWIQCKGEFKLHYYTPVFEDVLCKLFFMIWHWIQWRHLKMIYSSFIIFGIQYGANCKTHILNLIYSSSIQNGIETVKSSDVECVFLPGRWMMTMRWG